MSGKHINNDPGDRFCDALLEMQALCADLGLNYRVEMARLAEQWIERHAPSEEEGSNREEP